MWYFNDARLPESSCHSETDSCDDGSGFRISPDTRSLTLKNINKNRIGFVEWIINTVQENKKLGLFTDVLFSPISIWDLVNEIVFLINTNNINSETLHIAGELCTKYEFGSKLLETLGLPTNKLCKNLISSFEGRIKRSNDQSLDSSFYQKKYNRNLVSLDQTINKIKEYYEYN